MGLFSEIFSWWGGNTWGTRLYTWRKGRLVGEDEFGNRYYVQNRGVGPLGVPARWVTYANLSEASQIPPGSFPRNVHRKFAIDQSYSLLISFQT